MIFSTLFFAHVDTRPDQRGELVSVLVQESGRQCGAEWNLGIRVVQAEAWGLVSRFGLFASPTRAILEDP